MGDYKAIRKKKGAIERYDLNSDLGEQHDIAEQYPEAITRAAAIFGPARTPNPNWRVAAKTQAAPRRQAVQRWFTGLAPHPRCSSWTEYEKASIDLTLFDLDNDIGETKDVKNEHPDVVATMQKLADQMRQDLGDSARKIQGTGRRPAGRLEKDDPRCVVQDGLQTLVKSP